METVDFLSIDLVHQHAIAKVHQYGPKAAA